MASDPTDGAHRDESRNKDDSGSIGPSCRVGDEDEEDPTGNVGSRGTITDRSIRPDCPGDRVRCEGAITNCSNDWLSTRDAVDGWRVVGETTKADRGPRSYISGRCRIHHGAHSDVGSSNSICSRS